MMTEREDQANGEPSKFRLEVYFVEIRDLCTIGIQMPAFIGDFIFRWWPYHRRRPDPIEDAKLARLARKALGRDPIVTRPRKRKRAKVKPAEAKLPKVCGADGVCTTCNFEALERELEELERLDKLGLLDEMDMSEFEDVNIPDDFDRLLTIVLREEAARKRREERAEAVARMVG